MINSGTGTYWTDFACCTPLKRSQHNETWLLVVCQCKGIECSIELVNMWILLIQTSRL